MTNSLIARLKGAVGQTFRTLQEVRTIEAQFVRYASAMDHYTPSHRARHQMLAWHAATKQAEEMKADALDEIAATSKASIDVENMKTTLNKSGSVAATNLPFTNGVSQKREFSTTSFWLKSKNAEIGRVSSDETMRTDTTFATSSSSTHTTSGSSSTPKSKKSSATARPYSSKPKPTPEQQHLTDEEHRLQDSLIKANNLMNQDEGMNPNEDKEGMRIHPVSTHHNHNHSRHQKKHASAGLGSASASPVPGKYPAGKPLASAANLGAGVGAPRSYATKAKPKAMKEGEDNSKGPVINEKKPAKSTSSTTSGSASVAATTPGESPAGTPAASAAHVGGGVGATRAYATSAKEKKKKKTVGEAILESKGDFTNLVNTKKLTEDKKTSASVAASNPGESPAGNPAASAAHPGGGVGASRAYSTTAKSTKAKRQEAERHAPEIVSSEGQFLNTNEIKETHEYPPLERRGLNPLPEKKGVRAGREEAGEDRLRNVEGLNGDLTDSGGGVKVVGSPNHHHHAGHHKKPPTSTAAVKRRNFSTSTRTVATRGYATTPKGFSEKNNMKSSIEDVGNARAREETRIVDNDAESPNRVHHKGQHKKPHSSTSTGAVKSRNYATSTKPKKQAPKEYIDEMTDERLMDRNEMKVERDEYTRSGTDNEVASDPEAYCRKHLHPEDELKEEEERNEKAHNHSGHNPLQFSPANADLSKPPQNSERHEAAHDAKQMKSGPGKTRKGHKVGTRLGDEKVGDEKVVGEPGL